MENFKYCKRIAKELEMYINGEITTEEGEIATIYDYMSEILDFEITLDSQLNYTSCRVYVTLGGPTVWIDTHARTVELRWGNKESRCYISNDVTDEIDGYFEEYYNSIK